LMALTIEDVDMNYQDKQILLVGAGAISASCF
jgi:hypothetical protein